MTRGHTSAGGAFLFILLLSCGEFAAVGGQYLARFDGVVIARQEGIYHPFWSHNRTTRYVIRESDGRERVYYADPSLGRLNGFPIGTHLTKQRWRMDYEADGEERNDFPFPLYLFWMLFDSGLMIGCIIIGVMINIRDRHTRELQSALERAEERLREGD